MNNRQNQYKLLCPECDNDIESPHDIKIGIIVECPACASESEVISLNPPVLSPLEEEK